MNTFENTVFFRLFDEQVTQGTSKGSESKIKKSNLIKNLNIDNSDKEN